MSIDKIPTLILFHPLLQGKVSGIQHFETHKLQPTQSPLDPVTWLS